MKKLVSKIVLALAVVGILGFSNVPGALAYNERTIHCSEGSFLTLNGPSQYWYKYNNYGWCHNPSNWNENGQYSNQSPYSGIEYSMRMTYSGCSLSNWGVWNMGNEGGYYAAYAFVPSNHATTTNGHYTVTYNGGSGQSTYVNQNNLYDDWAALPGGQTYKQIMNIQIDDVTCEGSTRQIGVDEAEKCYDVADGESDPTGSTTYCPGTHGY